VSARRRRRPHRALRLLAFGVVLALSAACGPRPKPNIILVVVDTLRADRVGAYGNPDRLTPFLDELAARGVVFTRAYASSSWTNPSVASLMTSRHQSQHQVLTFASILAASEVTLAEVLRANGYVTAGFSANSGLLPGQGFSQGFETYHAYPAQERPETRKMFWPPVRAETVNVAALEWLKAQPPDKPVFLYVQYMEPHTPYAPPPDALAHVMNGAPHPDLPTVNVAAGLGHLQAIEPALQASIQKAYDASIYDLDRHLRTLFQALEERGVLDDAVVVVTADHGEEFSDHGGMGHGKTLYNEVVHVPLLMLTPGDDSARIVESVTPLVDLAPTVLDLAGIRIPARFAGQSLCSLLGDVRCANPPVPADGSALSELNSNANIDRPVPGPHRHALVVGDDKVLTGFEPDQVQFYDLAADPGEQHPDAFDEPTRQALRKRLGDELGRASENAATPGTRRIDDETRERLRALGYAD
jgi:arylsulfatase A-like enzyme